MSPRQVAIDIECVPRTKQPNFDAPAGDWSTDESPPTAADLEDDNR